MIRAGAQPLDSVRLAENAALTPCYICGIDNTGDSELCRRCFAPMALAHQARTHKTRPQVLAAIGGSSVGKTVYLGMLIDMLSRQADRIHVQARGAFSINLQQSTALALARGEFPAKTPTEADRWNWVHCQTRAAGRKAPLELIMTDLAGEALYEEIDHPYTHEVIRPLLSKCAGALVLIDTVKLQTGSLDQDYFTMKLLSYLAELDGDGRQGWAGRPIAFVLTKADECEECFANPSRFAQSRAPGLWSLCQERFRKFSYFAAGVAGGCAFRNSREGRIRVPLRIEPRGIVEPFDWLVKQLKS
ncbi:MAG TPA: hypothetical protein VGX76_18980 [Pirellulales bacterium]|nr:hypothetical protein [Pirellulales bacterium]